MRAVRLGFEDRDWRTDWQPEATRQLGWAGAAYSTAYGSSQHSLPSTTPSELCSSTELARRTYPAFWPEQLLKPQNIVA
ncbi:hypothetical protein PG999_014524 [Apiospora kogelbergensis]|uniref:Uncharacterized protein n=1 Tax=Apiospora kogelbergensis TaxID=1337665 RepID=A0AAW0Q951_9PEZI